MIEVLSSRLDLFRVRVNLHSDVFPVSFSKEMVSSSLSTFLPLIHATLIESLVHGGYSWVCLGSSQRKEVLMNHCYVFILNDPIQCSESVSISLIYFCLFVLGDLHEDGDLLRRDRVWFFSCFSDAFFILNKSSWCLKALQCFYACGLCCNLSCFYHFFIWLCLSVLFRDARTHPSPNWSSCASIFLGFDNHLFFFFDFYFRHLGLILSFLRFKSAFSTFSF